MRHVGFRGAAVAFAVLFAAGCGQKMGQVEGNLVWSDGKPITELERSQVAFESAELRVSARGSIGADGTFTLTTTTPGDGAPVGEYRVMILEHRPTPEGAQVPLAKLDTKYSELATSGLIATVKPGVNKVTFTVDRAKK